MNWDLFPVLDAEASATPGGVTAFEIPPGVSNVNLTVEQSGTASAVVLQGSLNNSDWFQMMKVEDSATLHAVTTSPRYLRVVTSATADSHVVVSIQYQK
jgi:hypothetical protein